MVGCAKCGGLGAIEKDGRTFECECSLIRRISASMPLYIRKADVQKAHMELPLLKCIRKHLMVISSWADMKAIMKILIISNPNKFIRVSSDREIRDVYVGAKSRAAKGDDDGKIYNSLEDLMDPPDLVIVRLNELSYKNKAASGALVEAVSYRTDRDKPIWLFNDTDKPFTNGSHAYSDSVADLIKTSFPIYRVERISSYAGIDHESIMPVEIKSEPVSKPTAAISDKSLPVVKPKLPEPEPEPVEIPKKAQKPMRIRPSQDDEVETGLGMYGAGISTSGSKFRRKS